MNNKEKKQLGYWGEEKAKQFLIDKGFRCLHQNWKAGRGGELDLVFLNETHLLFVEVKTRQENSYLPAELSIGIAQQKKILEMAGLYLQHFPDYTQNVRFDTIGVTILSPEHFQIIHLEEAFYAW